MDASPELIAGVITALSGSALLALRKRLKKKSAKPAAPVVLAEAPSLPAAPAPEPASEPKPVLSGLSDAELAVGLEARREVENIVAAHPVPFTPDQFERAVRERIEMKLRKR